MVNACWEHSMHESAAAVQFTARIQVAIREHSRGQHLRHSSLTSRRWPGIFSDNTPCSRSPHPGQSTRITDTNISPIRFSADVVRPSPYNQVQMPLSRNLVVANRPLLSAHRIQTFLHEKLLSSVQNLHRDIPRRTRCQYSANPTAFRPSYPA